MVPGVLLSAAGHRRKLPQRQRIGDQPDDAGELVDVLPEIGGRSFSISIGRSISCRLCLRSRLGRPLDVATALRRLASPSASG